MLLIGNGKKKAWLSCEGKPGLGIIWTEWFRLESVSQRNHAFRAIQVDARCRNIVGYVVLASLGVERIDVAMLPLGQACQVNVEFVECHTQSDGKTIDV